MILSAFESTKRHVEFCWSSAASFQIIVRMVVLFLNDMLCFAFEKRAVGDRAKDKRMDPYLRKN